MSATFATCCHHETASGEPRYADEASNRAGCAPSLARSWRYASTSARYWAFAADHGVTDEAPHSSFSTTSGDEHPPLRSTAAAYCPCAAAAIVAGSAGASGVPTLRARWMSNEYVAAPSARAWAE